MPLLEDGAGLAGIAVKESSPFVKEDHATDGDLVAVKLGSKHHSPRCRGMLCAKSSLVMNFIIEFFRARPSDEAPATLDRISDRR